MMETRPYLLHALSPLHVGTGQSVGVIDLPIARMRASHIPFVPGSSLKGVLREARRAAGVDTPTLAAVFGPWREKTGPEGDVAFDHAGALVVGDARLLALPVRSFVGTFALVTSPLLLNLARRDLAGLEDLPGKVDALRGPAARTPVDSVNVPGGKEGSQSAQRLYLEELDLEVERTSWVDGWARFLTRALPKDEQELLARRLAVVDDETMGFLWETATQVDTRVRIDAKEGTVAQGALWTEESLPSETLLVGVLAASRNLGGKALTAPEVLAAALPGEDEVLQLGGKATIGRGRCRLLSWQPASPGLGGAR